MTTITTMTETPSRKSTFDSGNWSPVNGLPGQDDIINYLEHLLSQDVNQCFTRRQLMDAVINEFGIPTTAAEAEGPKSTTSGFYTRMTYLITDAVQGKRRADGNRFAKRIRFGVYQHINGNGVLPKELKPKKKLSERLVEQVRVSVRILKNLKAPYGPYSPERVMVELGGRSWSDDVIEEAINREYANT